MNGLKFLLDTNMVIGLLKGNDAAIKLFAAAMKRIELLGCPMNVATMDETVSLIDEKVAARSFTQHVVVNVAKIVNMRKNPTLSESVRACEIINIDGMGVVLGARILGHDIPERVAPGWICFIACYR